MEFLLQMFAEFLGTPSVENESSQKKESEEKNISQEIVSVEKETTEDEPVIFGLMQFH